MTPQGSPVESYLDTMFDRLAGTGAEGRRLLADAESHLLESAAAGRERGLTDVDAERDAVARFGPMDAVTRRMPVPEGSVRAGVRHVLIGAWALAGAGPLWYGLSGMLTWLMGWPWARLLISTDRFGSWPPCGSGGATTECLRHLHESFGMVPAGGARFPYPFVALLGAVVLAALLLLRRVTRLGTPAWTPPRASVSLTFLVPFAVVGVLLVIYGVVDMADHHYGRLSYLVAGLLALAAALGALRWIRIRRPAGRISTVR